MPEATDIQIHREGRAGRMTLDRPAALDALTYGMLTAIVHALDEWRRDTAVEVVILDGAGGRALCAGGDVYRSTRRERQGQVTRCHAGAALLARRYFERRDPALSETLRRADGTEHRSWAVASAFPAHARHRFVTERSHRSDAGNRDRIDSRRQQHVAARTRAGPLRRALSASPAHAWTDRTRSRPAFADGYLPSSTYKLFLRRAPCGPEGRRRQRRRRGRARRLGADHEAGRQGAGTLEGIFLGADRRGHRRGGRQIG